MLKQIVVFLVMTLIILASSWALLYPGFFRVHDFVHGARIAEMALAVQDGHIPARWSQNFGYGYGMPLFQFYAPLPYLIGALFFIIGFPLVSSIKLLFLLSAIFTAIGSYKLGKILYGKVGGLLTSAAITLAPYRAVNLFIRGAVSEVWAIMAIVWILYFTFQAIKEKKYAWFGLVISLITLFLSHNLMTLLFIPVGAVLTVAYAVLGRELDEGKSFFSTTHLQKLLKLGFKILSAYVVAIGISAFYLFPAFLEKNYTKIEQYIIGGYFDYHLHFVYLRQFVTPFWGYGGSEWGPSDGISFFLGFGQLIGLVLFCYVVVTQFIGRRKSKVSNNKILFLMVIGAMAMAGLLFATEKSVYFWDSIELLKFVQFPWRTLSVVLICVGLLVPSFLLLIPSFIHRWFIAWLALLLLLMNAWMFRPEMWLDNADALYYSSPERIRKDMSSILPDYISVELKENIEPATDLLHCVDCEVKVLVDRTHEKLVEVKASQVSEIIFSVAYYPGWKAEINGKTTPLNITEDGLMSIEIPATVSKVGLFLEGTPLRNTADMISVVSFVIFVGTYLYSVYPSKQRRHEH